MRFLFFLFTLTSFLQISQGQNQYLTFEPILSDSIHAAVASNIPNKSIHIIQSDLVLIREYFENLAADQFIIRRGQTETRYFKSAAGEKLALRKKIEAIKSETENYSVNYPQIGTVVFTLSSTKQQAPANFIFPDTNAYQLVDPIAFEASQNQIIEDQQKKISKRKQQLIGKKAKKFIFTTLDGKKYNSTQLKGKVLVLNFWFVNCGPCRKEMPALNQLVEAYAASEDVLFFALALDPSHELKEDLKTIDFDFQHAGDALYIGDKFGISNYPTNIVIDKNGVIRAFHLGYSPDIQTRLTLDIEAALKR